MLVAQNSAISLTGEWLEAFWCDQCQETKWYHVYKISDRAYEVMVVPSELWQRVQGVLDPQGNPSVGEFTRRQSRMSSDRQIKDFHFTT